MIGVEVVLPRMFAHSHTVEAEVATDKAETNKRLVTSPSASLVLIPRRRAACGVQWREGMPVRRRRGSIRVALPPPQRARHLRRL